MCTNIHVQVMLYCSSVNTYKSRITGLQTKCMLIFIRNSLIVFPIGHTILHSHQLVMRVLVALHPLHLEWSGIINLAILIGTQWYPVAVLIFLMSNNIEHLFICSFSICMSSLGKCLFKYFAHLKLFFLPFYYYDLRIICVL